MTKEITLDRGLETLSDDELNQVSGGLISPDGDLSAFPVRFWPIINPGQLIQKVATPITKVVIR